ncbi:MAG: hypothetical protein K9G71_18440, partial [Rhodobacteraceae bacterium]|nr:hypothetical protein [Paracoccaceae bacterium]MCF8516231.1 hypothetical protein [Paracoccaceae bacterium]MCF8520581.1 hypothetical protein [Paracoccaceae bacterium]
SSRSTKLNSDPLASSVPRIFTLAIDVQRVNHVPQNRSRANYFSTLLDMHFLYAEPGAADVLGRDYDQAGFITLDLLKQTLRHGRHDFYICGPDPMMKALIPALLDWGVDNADIHRESFGPQTAVPTPLAPTIVGPVFPIGFRRSGRTIDWTG